VLPLAITQNFAVSPTGIRMSLVVVGINHRTAPVEVRERVVFEPARMPEALRELAALPAVRESLIVSTCNRTEIYCASDSRGAELGDWLQRYHQLGSSIHHCLYRHEDLRVVAHVFSVASGLDSLVLGEPQILGQLKDAYRIAQEAGTTGPELNRLFQAAFSVAKRVRTDTEIGANAVSVAYAAVRMARTVFATFENRTALLVGAGDTIALAARHLHADGLRRMIVANRSVDRARELAAEFQGFAIGLDEIASHLREADIVIASTASPNPIITRAMAQDALRARKRRPMFMVDIAVPRDIEPEVAELEDVYLFTIDDLQTVVNENMESRRQAAREAGEMISSEVDRFEMQLRSREAAPTIRRLRSHADQARRHTLDQARHMVTAGRSTDEVLEFLSTTLTNRLIHAPSQRLRDAAETGDGAIIDTIADIYHLDRD
jgi:glutamyl-tRNA reductase